MNLKDGCVRIDGKICLIKNIILYEGNIFFVYQVFGRFENVFECLLELKLLGIVKVLNLGNIYNFFKLNDVELKCVLLLLKNKFIVILFIDVDWQNKVNFKWEGKQLVKLLFIFKNYYNCLYII